MKAQLILTATIATLLSACSSEPKPTMEARTEAAREEADHRIPEGNAQGMDRGGSAVRVALGVFADRETDAAESER